MLGIEYDGRPFHGFQRQVNGVPSIQQELERALSQVADEPVRTVAAGRTDAGVHATGQVVGFRSDANRTLSQWRRGVDSLTSPAIRVNWCHSVPDEFNARFSAIFRRYLFCWHERENISPLLTGLVVVTDKLNIERMNRGAQLLLGEKDFTTFRGSGCQSRTAFRFIQSAEVRRAGGFVLLDIKANAFLLHMVRNIASALWELGLEKRSPAWIADILSQKDRTALGKTAPADGLYLVQVGYPDANFPTAGLPPFLCSGLLPDWF